MWTAIEGGVYGLNQLVDRYGTVFIVIEGRALLQGLIAEGDVHVANQLIDRDRVVAVAIVNARLCGGSSRREQ